MKLLTAPIKEPLCVFLVGMQCRSWRSYWKLPFIGHRMMKMQMELRNNPASGFLWGMNFSAKRPFTTLFLSYWKSAEHIEKFVTDTKYSHRSSTGSYYERFRNDPSIGIWHETYQIAPGHSENLYYGMPPFGASGFLKTEDVEKNSNSFIKRMKNLNKSDSFLK